MIEKTLNNPFDFKGLNKTIKKVCNYASITTIVLGTSLANINTAYAGNTTVTADDEWDSTLKAALDASGEIIVNGTVTLTITGVDIDATATGGIILGDAAANVGTEAVALDINSTAALTINRDIEEVAGGGAAGAITIDDDASGAAPDTVTFKKVIGASVAPNTITVGTAGGTGGHAVFEAAVVAGAIGVNGGDASEVSTVDFQAASTGTITLNDDDAIAKAIFSADATATIASAIADGADGEGTVQVTGTGKTFTGAIGTISTFDADATTSVLNTLDARIIDVATGTTLTTDDDVAGDATTLNGTSKIIFATDAGGAATTAVTAVIDGGSAGSGTIQNTNTSLTTVTGNVGTTTSIGTLDADTSITFVGEMHAAAVDVAAGATVTVDDDFTGTVTTLTTTGTLAFVVDADGAAVTTVTGAIDGAAAEGGDIQTNNSGGTTFAGTIGATNNIGDLNIDEAGTFNTTVSAETMDVAASKVATFKGALTVTDDSVLNGQAVFTGTSAYTVNAFLQEGAGAGNIDVTNTSTGGVTFQQIIGHNDAGADDAIDKLTISNSGSRAVIQGIANEVDQVDIAAGGILEIDRTITNGSVVFSNSADTVAADLPTTAKIYMPSNLKDGQSIFLLSDVTTTTTIATNLATAIQDNALYTYTPAAVDNATGDDVAGDDDVKITAVKRTAAGIASQLGTTTNIATGLYEASRAAADGVSTDSAAVDAMSDAINGSSGFTTADATRLAKQVAPQTDLISGSSVAAQSVTGSVQGIMSNRMASLRSGDAYYGTGVAAGGMSAQSGFIQVFGSTAEQDSTKVGSGTQEGFDSDSQGLAIGFDGVSDGGLTVGVSVSTANTDVDGKGIGKSTNSIDTYSASLYMDTATENGYVEGSLTYGVNENSTSRKINSAGLDRTLSGSYDSHTVSLNLSAGMPNEVGAGYLTPFGSFTATAMDIDAYTETSTLANDSLRLKVAQDDVNSMVGTVGLKFHGEMSNGGMPMISLAINNEFGDNTIESTNTFQGGGTAFKTTTAVEELSATLGLGYSYGTDSTSIEFAYEADANDDDYLSHYGSIKIVGKF